MDDRRVHRLTPTGMLCAESVEHIRNAIIYGGFALIGSDSGPALAAAPHSAAAIEALRLTLGKPEDRLSCVFPSIELLGRYAELGPVIGRVAQDLLPGPLTICAPMSKDAERAIGGNLAGEGTIGGRLSESVVELQLTAAFGHPLTTTAIRDDRGEHVRDMHEACEIVEAGLVIAEEAIGRPLLFCLAEGKPFRYDEHSTVAGFDQAERPRELRPGSMPFHRVLEATRRYGPADYADWT